MLKAICKVIKPPTNTHKKRKITHKNLANFLKSAKNAKSAKSAKSALNAFVLLVFVGVFCGGLLVDFAIATQSAQSTQTTQTAQTTQTQSKESTLPSEQKAKKSDSQNTQKNDLQNPNDASYNPLQIKAFDLAIKHSLGLLEDAFIKAKLESYANPLFLRAILSLIAFGFLWLFRRILTRFVMWLISLSFHLAKQDKQSQSKIQREIIKPVSLFLFLLSLDISINILYYPHLSPKELEKWFAVGYVINFGWFIIIALRGYAAIFINAITQKSDTQRFRKEVLNLLLKIAYFFIIIIMLLWILKILGFNISAIIASLGLGGLAVALAVKDMLANFFASVMLLFDNSFSQGDRIECGGVNGVVVEMGLRRTTIRTSDNALVLIPNSELANKSITNWSRRKAGRLIKLSIGLTYATTRTQVIQCASEIKKMLLSHPQIAQSDDEKEKLDFSVSFKQDIISVDDYLGYKANVYVVLDELADSSINLLVYCFSRDISYGGYLLAKEEILLEIMRIVDSFGLSFAFPSQSVYVEQMPPNTITSSVK